MAVCSFLSKYILYVYNLMHLISGVVILLVAALINHNFYKWNNFMNWEMITVPKILMAVGVIILIIAFIGLSGVIADSRCLLTLFSLLITVVLVGELLLSVYVYYMRSEIKEFVQNEMNRTIHSYNMTDNISSHGWNMLQSDMECCGINGPQDWKSILKSDVLPNSCCYAIPVNGSCTKDDSYTNGCLSKFVTFVQDYNHTLILTLIGFAVVQLFAVLLACCRNYSIREAYETV